MRIVVYLLLVAGCAALPIQRLPVALPAAGPADNAPTAAERVPLLERFSGSGSTTITALELEDWANMLVGGLPLALATFERGDLLLLDGRMLRAARIAVVGESTVTVVHAEGVTDVEIERVPRDEVERAQADLLAAAAEHRRIEAEVAAREAERVRVREARLAAELQERLVLAIGPADLAGGVEAVVPLRQITDSAQRLLALQARFPARKKGRNQLGIEFDLPPRSVWSFYSSYFLAATLEQLPETLAILEARLAQDLAAWEWKFNSTRSIAQSAEHVQAEQTVAWLTGTLRGFLQEARQLTRTR